MAWAADGQTHSMMGRTRKWSNINDRVSAQAAGVVRYKHIAHVAAIYGITPMRSLRSFSIPHPFPEGALLTVTFAVQHRGAQYCGQHSTLLHIQLTADRGPRSTLNPPGAENRYRRCPLPNTAGRLRAHGASREQEIDRVPCMVFVCSCSCGSVILCGWHSTSEIVLRCLMP